MLGIVFAAEARVAFDEARLRELAQASERHARAGVTGHAYFHDGRLIQYVEGPEDAVEEILAEIADDPRFALRQVVRTEHLAQRRLDDWGLDTCAYTELMDLRLEHVLEALLQNLSSEGLGPERTQAAIWRLVDAIAHRKVKAGKAGKPRRVSTRLTYAH